MAFNPGRNVGRLSIRVVPNATAFRNDLKRQLERIARTTSMSVGVDKARVNSAKLREDIRRQVRQIDIADVTATVKASIKVDERSLKDVAKITPTVDTLTVERLRRDIKKALAGIEADLKPTIDDRRLRQQMDVLSDAFDRVSGRLANDVLSPSDAEKLRHRLNEIKDQIDQVARNREARIDANPFTAWAAARLAWLTRPRTVEIVAKISKSSVIAVLGTMSALSGARLSWKWIDDLATSLKNLDKNLPGILGMTTSITSLAGSIFAATSGLVGIGQGLFAVLPAFLVLPGLILNAAGSVTALIVALRNAGTELAPLKDDMSELGDIINDAFWGKARRPILDLVNGLMPQLRTSFRDLSLGIGEFTAALSKAFGKELANGRLASIFSGIAEGWRVLGTGAEGFAGALVSLSNIAATYTPRLAGWFVRQANTFDAWLKAIAEDGRLSRWMEDAIDSMYDLWDVTRGVGGVFAGLWKAADASGSGGLKGFAQLMLSWREIVNGADFQRGLTAIFRGSHAAMDSFGDAIRGLGRLVADLDSSFEGFIASAGKFLGGLIEGAANALNRPAVGRGLDDLSAGLIRALNGVLPALPAIATTFGSFLGLLGDLAGQLLPTAAGVLADLMPALDALIGAIRPILPDLASAVSQISSALAPAIAEFVEAAGPLLADALVALAEALVSIAPTLVELIEGLAEFVRAIREFIKFNEGWVDDLREQFGGDPRSEEALKKLSNVTKVKAKDDGNWWTVEQQIDFGLLWDKNDAKRSGAEIAKLFTGEYERVLATKGKDAAAKMLESFRKIDGLPKEVVSRINGSLEGIKITSLAKKGDLVKAVDNAVDLIQAEFDKNGLDAARTLWSGMSTADIPMNVRQAIAARLDDLGITIAERGRSGGGGFSRGLAMGITGGLPDVDASLNRVKSAVRSGLADAPTLGTGSGAAVVSGFSSGVWNGIPGVQSAVGSIAGAARSALAGAGALLLPAGANAAAGFNLGIRLGGAGAVGAANSVRDRAVAGFTGGATYSVGLALSAGLAAGIRDGRSGAVRAAAGVVRDAISAARKAGEIRSPSRKTARLIGKPLAQGVAVGIKKNAAGIRQSMVSATDLSGISGSSPVMSGAGASRSGVQLHIHNPVVRDLHQETWEAAQMAGVLT